MKITMEIAPLPQETYVAMYGKISNEGDAFRWVFFVFCVDTMQKAIYGARQTRKLDSREIQTRQSNLSYVCILLYIKCSLM